MGKISESSSEAVYNKALRFATLRPRSEHEISLWFKRKNISTIMSSQVFNRLKNLGLVNDKAFSEWWIDQRVTFRPKGRKALFFELRQKGVARDTIESVLKNVEVPSETALAAELVAKKLSRFKDLPEEERKKKLVRFLARRGFSWDIIKQTLAKI